MMTTAVSDHTIKQFRSVLIDMDRSVDNAARIDLLRALEELKGSCAGAQALLAADLDASTRKDRGERGVPVAHQGRGINAQVALARRESVWSGTQHLSLARALNDEMPYTLRLLIYGAINEQRATILMRETACLTVQDRAALDREFCCDADNLAGCGDQQLTARIRARTAEVDAESMVRRARKAVGDRRVTSRPAPDTMCYLSVLLPVTEGVAVHATLMRDADSILARGDDRTRAQIMADLVVERVTGIGRATPTPVTVNLVISDQALFGDATDPAHANGYGPIPAGIAREWIAQSGKDIRRLYACPSTGELTAMESKSRIFPKGLAQLIDLRDRSCRTPWCDAPVRHRDHIRDHQRGGATSAVNGAGLCAACNYAKQGLDWYAETDDHAPGTRHSFTTTTPTGHRYSSVAPPLPMPWASPEAA
ncbi:HNH endonuclease [Rhodococcus globerulus]